MIQDIKIQVNRATVTWVTKIKYKDKRMLIINFETFFNPAESFMKHGFEKLMSIYILVYAQKINET